MTFDDAFYRVIGVEGGLVDNPHDPGGVTNWGISKRAYPNVDILNLTQDGAKKIYYSDYWLKIGADMYPFAIGYQVFDAAVNHGPHEAAKLLQTAVGAYPDGDIGPQTQAAISALSVTAVVCRFISARLRFYGSLPTFSSFGRGWTTNRVPTLLDYAASDLST